MKVRSARIDRGGVIADVAEGVGLRHALAISVPNPNAKDRRFMSSPVFAHGREVIPTSVDRGNARDSHPDRRERIRVGPTVRSSVRSVAACLSRTGPRSRTPHANRRRSPLGCSSSQSSCADRWLATGRIQVLMAREQGSSSRHLGSAPRTQAAHRTWRFRASVARADSVWSGPASTCSDAEPQPCIQSFL